jgi:hypothetical protein
MGFKVIAINYALGEEYILDLNDNDIMELIEGNMRILS